MKSKNYMTLYRHDLSSFFRCAFNILHPRLAYQHNWHIDLMAHYLEKVNRGEINRLIINMPPRMLKSQCVSVAWPAWMLGRNPQAKILCLHAGTTLGRELHEDCSQLMMSPRFRALFPNTPVTLGSDRLITPFSGRRQFMPIMSRLTGLGADVIIIDDPISPLDARKPEERKRLNEQFDQNIVQRLNDKKNGAIVLVMQRLHEDDLTAHLLQKNEDWVHLNLPAIAMESETWELPHGQRYQRLKGAPLHEVRESRVDLMDILFSIGGYAFAYQYLQGLYKPQFGEEGHGCLWLTPYREGVIYDAGDIPKGLHGFYRFNEFDLIGPKVFGIGEDPYPDDMRHLTVEEWTARQMELNKTRIEPPMAAGKM